MRINRRPLQAALAAAAMLSAGAAHADTTPLGTWIDHTGRGAVEIKDCDGKLCGYIAWVKDPKNSSACGEQILGNVKKVASNTWDKGWIYDPDSDSKYDVELKPLSGDKLRVMGYAGTKWLSETMTWKRAPDDLATCTKATSAEADKAAPEKEKKAAVAEASKTKADDKPDSKAAAVEADEEKPAKVASTTPGDEINEPAEAAETEYDDDETADDGSKKRKAGKIVARIADELGVKVKKGGKSSISGKETCQMRVPYVDMTVSFPCKDD